MRNYRVNYCTKANKQEYHQTMYVQAANAREACRICKEEVKKATGKNAFRPTAEAADQV